MSTLKLGILDQSPILQGATPREALLQTLALASEAERLGYSRFWVSEHHDAPGLAGSSPEVLIAAIGAHTDTIRIGAAGVLLPHYSPYKVAENFRVLEGLYPGRIDLGIGRAPGGMPLSTRALRYGRMPSSGDAFPDMLREMTAFLHSGLPQTTLDYPFAPLVATPVVDTTPQLWLLGSSDYSGKRAAELGAGFVYAHFINGEGGPDVVSRYWEEYKPGPLGGKPAVNVCVLVVCADSDSEAERLATCVDLRLLRLENGDITSMLPTFTDTEEYVFSSIERIRIDNNRRRMIVGGSESIGMKLREFAASYQTDELVLLVMGHDYNQRLHSYRLIAEAVLG
jgi:luciferase family oxidoreductase group 1